MSDPISWYLAATLASQHFPYHGQNQFNPGIGIEARQGSWGTHVGEYLNSQSHPTYYALASWQPLRLGGLSAGVIGGFAHGYDRNKVPTVGPINIAAGGVVSYEYRGVGANILLEPNVAALQIKVRFQ